jgi:ABC-type Fe3+-hydroxamate transport system substrate-binding protein
MPYRWQRLRRFGWLGALWLGALGLALASPRVSAAAPARRVISLNPSLTQIAIALGARDRLIGVDDYSHRLLPEIAELPRVGGLFNPSLEAIVALEPDLVALVPSAEQRALREELEALGIRVLAASNHSLDEVLTSIETLGAALGRDAEARARVAELRSALADRVSEAPRVRCVLVLNRDPLFVAGRGSYLDALLHAAGGENVAASFAEPYPRASNEWLVATAPDVILDASGDAEPARRYWERWPSLPAVASGRVIALEASEVTMPGPYLERALAAFRAALRGDGVGSRE